MLSIDTLYIAKALTRGWNMEVIKIKLTRVFSSHPISRSGALWRPLFFSSRIADKKHIKCFFFKKVCFMGCGGAHSTQNYENEQSEMTIWKSWIYSFMRSHIDTIKRPCIGSRGMEVNEWVKGKNFCRYRKFFSIIPAESFIVFHFDCFARCPFR